MANSITYSVPSPYSRQNVRVELEDWRAGWEPEGELVSDGLPVLRVFKENSSMYTLMRPYYLINAQNEYVVNPETQEKVIEFVTPLFDWKVMVREDGNRLDPIHKEPLHKG